jgi:hypothetical protein
MDLTRRRVLIGGAALLIGARGLPRIARAADTATLAALDKSRLIYLTPLLAGGRESTCHSEVWFVHHKEEVFVSTRTKAWRTEALRRGLTRARIWIGDFGVWKRGNDKFRSAPSLEIEGKIEPDTAIREEVLTAFGQKYADEWDKWGPRFREGFADGSRVLLRYRVSA